jgi:hypothetical protein
MCLNKNKTIIITTKHDDNEDQHVNIYNDR